MLLPYETSSSLFPLPGREIPFSPGLRFMAAFTIHHLSEKATFNGSSSLHRGMSMIISRGVRATSPRIQTFKSHTNTARYFNSSQLIKLPINYPIEKATPSRSAF